MDSSALCGPYPYQPLDPAQFIAGLQQRLIVGLDRLDGAIRDRTAGGVRITTRHGKPWIAVPPLGRLPDAPQLPALRAEIERRHGMIDLLDVLKEADHLSGFTDGRSRSPPGRSPTPTPHGDASCSSRSRSGRTSGSSGSPTR
jgi:hypothetical protein